MVTQLNKRVMDNAKGEIHHALCRGVQPQGPGLQYIQYGHNPPVLMSADGTTQQLELGCCGLGMFEKFRQNLATEP